MKKRYEIKVHGSGIYEVALPFFAWDYKQNLLEALKEISADKIITDIKFCLGIWRPSYVICTMPK